MYNFSKFLFFSFLIFFNFSHYKTEETDLSTCNDAVENRSLLLVSTLDGYFSALNIDNEGATEWSISTGPGPMLSSSMSFLELSENSQWVRIIPSLSGGLYKFNGEYIQPVPVNADSLLGSSFRFSEDVVISGGKEVRSYGVDASSGEVLYECSMNKCDDYTEGSNNSADVIVLQRDMQTVRALEPRTGSERWNFSVAQHNVKFLGATKAECKHNREPTVGGDIDIKVVVPEGLVFAVRKSNPQIVLWRHKFSSPVANVWRLTGNDLEWIDLFNTAYNAADSDEARPSVYVGTHNKQLYVQESSILQNYLQLKNVGLVTKKEVPKIRWMPFPATGPSLKVGKSRNGLLQLPDRSVPTTALSVLHSTNYEDESGFYLYHHNWTSDGAWSSAYYSNEEDMTTQTEDTPQIEEPVIVSLSYWWKEIALISVGSAFVVNFLCFHHIQLLMDYIKEKMGIKTANSETVGRSKSESDSGIDVGSNGSYVDCEVGQQFPSYSSRYLEDFEVIHVLGKGGFGVVFEAKNKIDDCHYAVKRITMPSREEARERVIREVKALAKLEHQHIVRYFNAWQECPPPGWQEQQDKLWKKKTSNILSSPETTVRSDPVSSSESHIKKSSPFQSDRSSEAFGFNINKVNNILKNKRNITSSDDSFIMFESDSKKPSFQEQTRKNYATTTSNLETRDGEWIENGRVKNSRVYLYIQMQLCQRNSLREWLFNNTVREKSLVLNMFDQILQAVEYVHLQGLIHRDLKPSNIFFSLEGQIKVGDFGLVTAMPETEFSVDQTCGKHRRNGWHTAYVGTELYMSPEQLNGESYDYKVDVYSLGIILFELLIPFTTQMERHNTLVKLRNGKYPPDFKLKYKDEHRLLNVMLSPRPEKRPSVSDIRLKPPLLNVQNEVNMKIQPSDIKQYFSVDKNSNFFNILPYSACEVIV